VACLPDWQDSQCPDGIPQLDPGRNPSQSRHWQMCLNFHTEPKALTWYNPKER